MQRFKFFIGVFALVLVCSSIARADQPATQPVKPAKPIRLTLPWSGLTTLSDEQKEQINQIHQEALAQIKAIHQREETKILALLSDDQKAELKRLDDQRKAEAKQKRAEKKKTAADQKD